MFKTWIMNVYNSKNCLSHEWAKITMTPIWHVRLYNMSYVSLHIPQFLGSKSNAIHLYDQLEYLNYSIDLHFKWIYKFYLVKLYFDMLLLLLLYLLYIIFIKIYIMIIQSFIQVKLNKKTKSLTLIYISFFSHEISFPKKKILRI